MEKLLLRGLELLISKSFETLKYMSLTYFVGSSYEVVESQFYFLTYNPHLIPSKNLILINRGPSILTYNPHLIPFKNLILINREPVD